MTEKITRKVWLFTLIAGNFFPVFADEGMWPLPRIDEFYPSMQKQGLALDVEEIYRPDSVSLKDAVVIFGNGCTGEVISSEGLILTNHHCGYSYIQQHSSLEHDLLTDGFWAKSREEELPNPGLTVKFIEKIEDVTEYVRTALAEDTADYSYNFLSADYLNELARKKAAGENSESVPGVLVEIKPFYGGNQYYMFTQRVYRDVRLVGTPPSSVGKFGADTDNWMWPRHTGDFSLFRVYTDKEGNPAPYSPENIPLRPKKFLRPSLNGVQENDFVMIMGFPGRTDHFMTPAEVMERAGIENAIRTEVREKRLQLMLECMLNNPEARIQYASKYASAANGYKSARGMNYMIRQQGLVALKRQQQQQLIGETQKSHGDEYKRAAETIDSLIDERKTVKMRQQYLQEALWNGIEASRIPTNFDRLIDALEKNDPDTIRTELIRLENAYRKFADKNYNPEVDKTIAKAMLKLYARHIEPDRRPSFFRIIDKKYKGNIDRYVDDLFEKSIFGSEENFDRFKKRPSVRKLDADPMVGFARSVANERLAVNLINTAYERDLSRARQTYIRGLMEMEKEKGKLTYPDANFTLRLTFGQIAPLSPADAVSYSWQTTMKGIMEKENPDNWEFIVPPYLKTLYENQDFGKYSLPDKRMPVAFIANTHTTGGNSGSPVLNARGELVGLGFDRNWEGISGDIQYNPTYQRTIAVDIRYVLFIIDKYAGAYWLIDEIFSEE